MGGFNFNPVLSEIQSHLQAMSPDAQAAVKMANPSIPSPQETAAAGAPSVIPPGMLLPHPDAGPPQGNISMPSPTPSLAPMSAPEVKAPRGTIEGDTNARGMLLGEKPGVDQIASRIEGSGFGQAHPFAGKLLGDTAQVAGKIGDTALGVGASLGIPALNTLAQDIPGTTAHHNQLLRQDNTALNQDVANAQKEAEANTENATAQHTNAETPQVAPNAESTRNLQGAEAGHANAETTVLQNPQDATPEIGTYRSLVKMGMSPSEALQEIEKDKAMALRPQQIAPEQQYLTEYAQTHPGSTVAQAEHQYMLDTQRPVQAPAVNMFVPSANGGETLQTIRPGQTVAPGAQTAAGVNAVNTPTMTQRTAAGRAETVISMVPDVINEINSLSSEIGPIAGRWDDFMQGKVGMDNPKFAGLRTDFTMLATAVALAHAQGRLPENLREEFDHMINAPQQTPENIKAVLQHILPWMQKMQEQGHPNAAPSNAPAAENWVRGADGKLVKQ
jgi:hypothetical protein